MTDRLEKDFAEILTRCPQQGRSYFRLEKAPIQRILTLRHDRRREKNRQASPRFIRK